MEGFADEVTIEGLAQKEYYEIEYGKEDYEVTMKANILISVSAGFLSYKYIYKDIDIISSIILDDKADVDGGQHNTMEEFAEGSDDNNDVKFNMPFDSKLTKSDEDERVKVKDGGGKETTESAERLSKKRPMDNIDPSSAVKKSKLT
ncbi:hypothetical protein TSUD_273020 [Trifolium subterraneum]|nr:hypothetical protein TSUD_273020 [Trifolium subterraneum]